MTELWVTDRRWEDLDRLDPAVAENVLRRFQERRGRDPESGETMSAVGGPVRKLHADLGGGRSLRAVTWWDNGHGVCWLMAAGRAWCRSSHHQSGIIGRPTRRLSG